MGDELRRLPREKEDFYIFGSLAALLSVKFFEQSQPVAALLSTLALFTAGFL